MKTTSIITIGLLFVACNSNKQVENDVHSLLEVTETAVVNEGLKSKVKLEVSSYENPEYAENAKELRTSIKAIADKGTFTNLHKRNRSTMSSNHVNYFSDNSHLQVLCYATGNLFGEKKEDAAFHVFNKKTNEITTLVYQASANTYKDLFREIGVRNGLEGAACFYGNPGTAEYDFASEIPYSPDYLRLGIDEFLQSPPIKIANITKDSTFYLSSGCMEPGLDKKEITEGLAIGTSLTYNNWEVLRYDKSNGIFVTFYTQEFAD